MAISIASTPLFCRSTPLSSSSSSSRFLAQCYSPASCFSRVAFGNSRRLASKNCGIAGASSNQQLLLQQASMKIIGRSVPSISPLIVIASRKCPLTGKKANNGYKVSFSNHRTKKLQGVNLQYKRLWWEEKKRFVKIRLSTNALKTIQKKGLEAVAKEAGIDLNKY